MYFTKVQLGSQFFIKEKVKEIMSLSFAILSITFIKNNLYKRILEF